nr:MAG TPA: hypothetical protein [Caudoviricetes sp.]
MSGSKEKGWGRTPDPHAPTGFTRTCISFWFEGKTCLFSRTSRKWIYIIIKNSFPILFEA